MTFVPSLMTKNDMFYLGVVGTRNWHSKHGLSFELVNRFLCRVIRHHPGLIIVSGAGGDIDNYAVGWGRSQHVPCIEYLPEWKRYGRAGGPRRNSFIVARSDALVAFQAYGSRGTQDSIDKARVKGIKAIVIGEDGKETL